MNREFVEKGRIDNQERLFFASRLDDDKTEYISKVVRTLREKGKGKIPFRYALLLSKIFHMPIPKKLWKNLGKGLKRRLMAYRMKSRLKSNLTVVERKRGLTQSRIVATFVRIVCQHLKRRKHGYSRRGIFTIFVNWNYQFNH